LAEKKSNIVALLNSVERAKNEKMDVFPHGGKRGGYVVVSNGKAYDVYVDDGYIQGCTCPDHENRHKICKHMIKVALEQNVNINGLEFADEKED
jgi:hypothetical protein